jgi:hypothetical protein
MEIKSGFLAKSMKNPVNFIFDFSLEKCIIFITKK